jgi:hypothetical protein
MRASVVYKQILASIVNDKQHLEYNVVGGACRLKKISSYVKGSVVLSVPALVWLYPYLTGLAFS